MNYDKKNNLIVLTGIDGSGKTTQAHLLVESLRNYGINVSYVWGRWEPFLLRPLIKRWKSRTAGVAEKKENAVNVMRERKKVLMNNHLIRWLWLICFFIDYGLQIFLKVRVRLFKGRMVVGDRIFYDSVIDQAVNLGSRKDGLLNGMDSLWFKIIFPDPSLVIYIDCPGDVAYKRKNDAPDIEYLESRRKLYLRLAERYGWSTLDGTLSVGEIENRIQGIVCRKLGI
jgi:dTMP kinase